ncbi:MAG: ATP-binding protein [Acidobacteria bacterium]|nr:ATP-binding protein [Acidobacteriota bacterium]MBV9478847.1 ATP-binding protein [Acidobacteriota bacterium]
MRLSSRILAVVLGNVAAAVVLAFVLMRVARAVGIHEAAACATTLLILFPVMLRSAHRIALHVDVALTGLDDGLRAFRDGDFSMRLAVHADRETGGIKQLYNEVADVLRAQRADLYQKELLLDTILQRTPMAVVLLNGADRVVYSNAAARELFTGGARLDGSRFAGIAARLEAPVRDALAAQADAIVTLHGTGQDETFHLTQRTFRLNTLEHRLILAERLTSELRRQEVAVWKKAIRVINHELNNTIAPISSLFHSARIAQEQPERRHKLAEIYESIEERLQFLRAFLEGYAQFARIPTPRKERLRIGEVLDDVRALYAFATEGDARTELNADRAQLQQVLINLVKNAHESGSAPDAIVVSIHRGTDGGAILRVTDAGRGMTDEVLRQALVPFYSTKTSGSGLGLPLCNEIVEAHDGRMRLQSRPDAGTTVTIWLPAA